MKKIFLAIICLLFTHINIFSQAKGIKQIYVIENKDNVLTNFKQTKTIFILSNIYSKADYEKILNDVWTVTDFEIVNFKDFNPVDYLSKEYSIALLNADRYAQSHGDIGYSNYSSTSYWYINISFFTYKSEKILEKINDSKIKDVDELFYKYRKEAARINFVYDNTGFGFSESEEARITENIYTKDLFINYKLGYIKNAIQLVNQSIKEEQSFSKIKTSSEIAELKNKTLYIPNYITYRKSYNTIDLNYQKTKEKIKKVYAYTCEFISDEELNDKILNNESIYYLSYYKPSLYTDINIINSKTGEFIYNESFQGMGFKIKGSNIESINKQIKKANK